MKLLNCRAAIVTIIVSGIGQIPYKPDAGPEESLVYKHYNPKEVSPAVVCVYSVTPEATNLSSFDHI